MAGPYYRMPSGKLPMIDGKPVFITEAQFLCCCCCKECPCDHFFDEYSFDTYSGEHIINDVLYRIKPGELPAVLSRVSPLNNKCRWQSPLLTVQFDDGSGWTDSQAQTFILTYVQDTGEITLASVSPNPGIFLKGQPNEDCEINGTLTQTSSTLNGTATVS